MRISFQNLPKDVMGLSKQQNIILRMGELLEAKVLKAGPKHALLNMKGQKILAEVKSELNIGDLVKVRVAGEVDNKILLRILNEGTTPRQNSTDQVLQNLGQKPEPEAKSALAFLLKNQLPVSKEALQALLTDQKNPLGQLVEKLISLANQQKSSGEPAQQSQAKGAQGQQNPTQGATQPQQQQQPAQASTGPTSNSGRTPEATTAQQGQQAQKAQPQLPNQGNIPPGGQTQDSTTGSTQRGAEANPSTQTGQTSSAQSANQALEGGNARANTAPPATAQQAQQIPGEQTAKQPIHQSPEAQSSNEATQTGQQPQGATSKGDQTLAQLLERIAQQRTGQNQQTADSQQGLKATEEGAIKPMSQRPGQNLATQNRPTLPLHQQLEQLGLAVNPAKDSGQLVKQLKNLVQSFGLQPQESDADEKTSVNKRLSSLFNSPMSDDQKQTVSKLFEKVLGMKMRQKEDGTLLHMEIPVLFNQPSTAQLRIRDDAPKLSPQSQGQPLSILFQLETEGLGQLKVMAVLQGNDIQCNFAAQREEVRKLIRHSLTDLKGRFADLQYNVHQMQVMPWVEEDDQLDEPLSGQVDFRV